MKIAVFYHLPFGGAKRVVKEHVKGLKNLGHTVDIYTINREEDIFDPSAIADNSINYIFKTANLSLPVIGRLIKDIQLFKSLKELHKKIAIDIDHSEYDIVLVHTDTYTQSPYVLRFLKTNNVYYCLEPLRIVYEYSLRIPRSIFGLNKYYEMVTRIIRKKIDRDNARSAMSTATLSLFGREYMIHAYDLYPKVIYLGIDTVSFHPLGIKRKNQVLFVAEKESIYGYDLALKAISLIPRKVRPSLRLVFGTSRTNRISETELVKLYSESLVTLSLSRFDTFGLVPLESMAAATPVIALEVGGYRETLGFDKDKYLVDFDPQLIADKIIEYAVHPDLSNRLGLEGRHEMQKNWKWEKQIKRLEDLLIEVANGKNK